MAGSLTSQIIWWSVYRKYPNIALVKVLWINFLMCHWGQCHTPLDYISYMDCSFLYYLPVWRVLVVYDSLFGALIQTLQYHILEVTWIWCTSWKHLVFPVPMLMDCSLGSYIFGIGKCLLLFVISWILCLLLFLKENYFILVLKGKECFV